MTATTCRVLAVLIVAACVNVGGSARQSAPGIERQAAFEKEVDAGYGGAISLAAGPHGDVHIAAWKQRKVRVDARISLHGSTEAALDELARIVTVVVDPTPANVDIQTRGPHDKTWMKNFKGASKRLANTSWRVDYTVWVPEYTSLTLTVSDGTTRVEGVSGIVGIVSARGDVALVGTSGATQVNAAAGNISIETRDRGWRGGNLSASCTGDLVFVAPPLFSATLDLTAPGGIARIEDGGTHDVGPELDERIGNGGASITLVASGKLTLDLRTKDETSH